MGTIAWLIWSYTGELKYWDSKMLHFYEGLQGQRKPQQA